MIDKSLERINTKSISLRSEKKAIPVYFSTNISKIKKKLTSANYNFLKALGFNSIYGNWIVLSDANGQISAVIVGLKTIKKNYSKFFIGSILSKLPKETYFLKNIPKTEDINLLALGFFLSFYSFKDFDKKIKHGKNTASPILSLPNFPNLDKTLYLAESEFIVRDLVNLPANILNPEYFESYVKKFSNFHNIKLKVVFGNDLKKNFPLIHAVGKASSKKPRFLELTYKGSSKSFNITLIGKGVCFDSGGLNLKSSSGMLNMKKDMSGAASVLGLAHYLIRSNLKLNLRILIPCVENSVSGKSFRPGDILISRSGMGVEIKNTDAEGRLILADTLTYATEKNTDILVTFASLTGAARVAVGTDITPFFSTSNEFAYLLKKCGDKMQDPVWQLPFYEDYNNELSSTITDLNNAPLSGMAGAIMAALFLKKFTNNHKMFLHFDIYGWNSKSRPAKTYGGLMQGVRSLGAAIEEKISTSY